MVGITSLDLGADGYMIKPFAFRELLARVRALVRRSYQTKNPRIEVQDLQAMVNNLFAGSS